MGTSSRSGPDRRPARRRKPGSCWAVRCLYRHFGLERRQYSRETAVRGGLDRPPCEFDRRLLDPYRRGRLVCGQYRNVLMARWGFELRPGHRGRHIRELCRLFRRGGLAVQVRQWMGARTGAYVIDGHEMTIRPAPLEREWMNGTNQRFAYRCPPLNIANAHGWEILNAAGFPRCGTGRTGECRSQPTGSGHACAGRQPLRKRYADLSHALPVQDGQRNRPIRDGTVEQAEGRHRSADGIIETDWSPYTFTMNWRFTRAGH